MESAKWKLVLPSCLKALGREGPMHCDLAKTCMYYHMITEYPEWEETYGDH